MNYIYYQTKTQFTNTGDALINRALIEVLRGYGVLKCNCSKNIPIKFVEELGIKESEKLSYKTEVGLVLSIIGRGIISLFNSDKVYVFSGLGHQWGGNYKLYIKNIIASVVFLLYRILGIKIIKIGSSIGPVTRLALVTEKIRSIFINNYYVRDTKSLELCHNNGIKKAKLSPDLSWLYLNQFEKKLNLTNIVTVNMRESILNEKDLFYVDSMKKTVYKILKMIEESFSEKIKVIFLYQVESDKTFCKNIFNELKREFDCEFVTERVTLESAKKIYGKSVYNISNRMHSLLLGYKYGSLPIVVIDKDKHIKISQTFKDSNLDEFIIDVYNSKSKNIEYILKNREELFSKLIINEKLKSNEIIGELNNVFKK